MIRFAVLAAFLTSACATAGVPALEPGTRRAAFSFELSSLETDVDGGGSSDDDSLALAGDVGWFVAPRTELGISPALDVTDSDDGVDEIETTQVTFGPYLRYYFPSGGSVIPFVDGRFAYADVELDVNNATADGDGLLMAAGAGILAPVASSVAIEFTASFVRADLEIEDIDVETDGFQLMVGISMFF